MLTFTLIALLTALLVYYAHSKYSYWSSRGIPGPRPIFPFGYVLAKALYAPQKLEIKWASTYGKLYGVYTGLAPTLTVADANLVKKILVTDFKCFVNRRHMNSYHPLWNDNLFMAEGEAWRRLRAITSPAFTVYKLKTMIPLMNDCVDQLVGYFERKIQNSKNVQSTFIPKDVFAGYTIDVICLTAFASQTDANNVSEKNEKAQNTLVENGKRFFNLNPFKILTILVLPRPILNWLNIRQPFKDDTFYFFADFARAVVRARKAELADAELQVPKRTDLVQMLIDAILVDDKSENKEKVKLNSSKSLTEDEIVAQIILFLGAGFETTSASLTFALFELVNHLDVQEKLYKEVIKDLKTEDDDFILNHCPYLEAVIKETTRLYSPVVRLERRVGVNGYQLKEGLVLDKGMLIEIPPSALHYSPDYWPNPFTFDPERFMPENAHRLVPYAYLPFGQGPRGCIGQRFAMQEMKLALAKLVRKFKFNKTTTTPEKLDFILGIPMLNARPFEVTVSRR